MVLTHEAHEIPLMAVFNTGDAFISGPSQYFAWSPDSRYVALIGRINNTENMDNAYLYNVQTNSLSATNADVAQKFRVVWSTDSDRLATLSEYCSTINT
jgi:Tol biopolymer transport system component